MDQHIILKEDIKEYLKIMDRVEPIINILRNQNKSIEDIKDIQGIEKYMIETKIKLLEEKSKYFEEKSKFEAAVEDYMEEKLSGKKTSLKKMAEIHKISLDSLQREVKRRFSLEKKYQYDRIIKSSCVHFSYQQEVLLLESFKLSSMLQFAYAGECICRTCFLLKLLIFAYEFAESNNKKCPKSWKIIKQADIVWLKDFEMRNSYEISTFCSENCIL